MVKSFCETFAESTVKERVSLIYECVALLEMLLAPYEEAFKQATDYLRIGLFGGV